MVNFRMIRVHLFTSNAGDEPGIREQLAGNGELSIAIGYPVPADSAIIDRDGTDAIVVWSDGDGSEGMRLLHTIRATGDSIPFIIAVNNPDRYRGFEALMQDADYYMRPGSLADSIVGLMKIIVKAVEVSGLRQALTEREKRIHAFFTQSPVGMEILDPSGSLVDANPAFMKIFGADKKEQLEKIHLIDVLELSESRKLSLTDNEGVYAETEFDLGAAAVCFGLPKPKSRTIVLETLVTPLCEPGRLECKGYLVHAWDITEQNNYQNALARLNRKLSLVGSVTRHDVLNQLTAVIGYNELLSMMVQEPKLIEYLKKERTAIEKIQRQFQFAKDYQNIGVESPRWQVIKQVVNLMNDELDIGSVRITVTTGNASIYADPLFEKVVYNLFDNALRHGGGISEIRVSLVENPHGTVLVVEDDGVGIPANEKEKVFERGYGKNTGWGLFLIREILEITSMTIVETGEPGKGARFEIQIPPGRYMPDGKTPPGQE
jgi:PAS domain S-box-containing protein